MKLIPKYEAALFLGISESTLQRMIGEQSITFYRVRGRVLFAEEDLLEYLKACRVPAKTTQLRPTQTRTPHAHYIPGMKVV